MLQYLYYNLGKSRIQEDQIMGKVIDRIGETRRNNRGLLMTIVAYRSCHDIDVQFEDGQIATHRKYNWFVRGSIAPPELHIGETKIANNGMKMTIIAYRKTTDIDVQFEDGYTIKGCSYAGFRQGAVKNPNVSNAYWKRGNTRHTFHLGETKSNNQGLSMTISEYRTADDIDVKFEDGTVREHMAYAAFRSGKIKNPNVSRNLDIAKEKVGETHTAQNGQQMTIIAWRGFHDIDVKFEDNTIVTKKRYDHFQRGFIINPNCAAKTKNPKDRVGQTSRAANGLLMTIEVYRNATDLDVRFENGILVQHKAYKEFKSGNIGCPGYGRFANSIAKYLGKKVKASNGQMMEVVGGTGFDDLTIRFEDSTEVSHVRSSSFYKGSVINPNYTHNDTIRDQLIGTTTTAKNGLKMTIVEYRGADDIDIEFEDGVKVCHKHLQHFKIGTIKHPDINPNTKIDMVGKTNFAVCGLNMEVISGIRSADINIKFETGYVAEHKSYYNFLNGKIGHPFPYQIGDVSMDKFAYVHNGIGNFYCHCTKCNVEDIMSLQEMREHKCIK